MSTRVRRLLAAVLVLLVGTLAAVGVVGHAAWVAYREVDPEVGRRVLEREVAVPSRLYARPLLLRLGESPELNLNALR